MNCLFVSYELGRNQIVSSYANSSLMYILAIILLIILLSLRRKRYEETDPDCRSECFAMSTTQALRGLAVLLLCFGHFAIKCIEGVQSFEYAAEYAVIIFLFLSGVGIAKSYNFGGVRKVFLKKRVRKLAFPLWITLICFYSLDYLLLDRTHSLTKFGLSFIGIINQKPPNGPDWFISYAIFLYLIYYFIARIERGNLLKISLLFIFSYFAIFMILNIPVLSYFKMWTKYPIVFPLAVVVGIYRETVFKKLKALSDHSRVVYTFCLVFSLLLYKKNFGVDHLSSFFGSDMVTIFLGTIRPLYLIAFITMFCHLMDRWKVASDFLLFLGNYSLEIYLLHLPFMVYYDFFLKIT